MPLLSSIAVNRFSYCLPKWVEHVVGSLWRTIRNAAFFAAITALRWIVCFVAQLSGEWP